MSVEEVKPSAEPVDTRPSAYESNKQLAVMVDMVNGNFDLPPETRQYMKDATLICARAAACLVGDASRGVTLDGGQLNAALQLLQQVKNKACDAAIIGAETKKRAAPSNWAAGEVAKRATT
jgi:hypothetical protein